MVSVIGILVFAAIGSFVVGTWIGKVFTERHNSIDERFLSYRRDMTESVMDLHRRIDAVQEKNGDDLSDNVTELDRRISKVEENLYRELSDNGTELHRRIDAVEEKFQKGKKS